MPVPARSSKLDPYGEEILSQHRQGRKLAEISKFLAQTYGLSVALSTLSEYVKRDRSSPPPTAAPQPPLATPAQEMLLDQVEVYAEIQASVRVVVEEVQALRNAFPDLAGLEGQLAALGRRLDGLKADAGPAPSGGPPTSLATALAPPRAIHEGQPPAERAPVPPYALIRRIWIRALVVTGILWLLIIAGAIYWFGW